MVLRQTIPDASCGDREGSIANGSHSGLISYKYEALTAVCDRADRMPHLERVHLGLQTTCICHLLLLLRKI